jgi:hypothetical protein
VAPESRGVPRSKKPSENHPVQNTIEIASHHLLYAAENREASETGESYAARDSKASEISQLSEAEMEKASEHMKP